MAPSSSGGTSSAVGSGTGSSAGSTGTSGTTGTSGSTGTTGMSGGWTVVGSIADPGQGNVFADNLVPLPGPSNRPQVVFYEGFGGIASVFTTYWDGGYVAPQLIFDGGEASFYNLQGTSWEQGRTNLVVAIDTHFNFVALEQIDGGTWGPLVTSVSPIPAGGMAPVFDQATGQAWIAGVAGTFTNGSNASLYRLDDGGVNVPLPNLAADSIAAAPCTKPDGGSLLCVAYVTGFNDQFLWVQTFDPLSLTLGTPGLLFDSADAGFDHFASGCAITEVSPGTVVAMAVGLGPGVPQSMQQYAWASFALTDLGTLQAPLLYASDAGSSQGPPGLWTWNGDAFLLFRQTSLAPESEVGVSLGGPPVAFFPYGAGVTSATAYPAGYADSSNVNWVALSTTAQGGKISVFSLSP